MIRGVLAPGASGLVRAAVCHDVLTGVLGGQAAAERDPGDLVAHDRSEGDREQDRARGRVTRGRRLPDQRQRDMPRVRHRPVRSAPERLDPDPVAVGHQLAGQPARRAPFGVGTWTPPLERRQRPDRLERSHRPDDRKPDPIETQAVTADDELALLAVARDAADAAAVELRERFGGAGAWSADQEHAYRPRLGRRPGGRAGDQGGARRTPAERCDPRRGGRRDRRRRRSLGRRSTRRDDQLPVRAPRIRRQRRLRGRFRGDCRRRAGPQP